MHWLKKLAVPAARTFLLAAMIGCAAMPAAALADEYYVTPSGSDTANACLDPLFPCRTIGYAIFRVGVASTAPNTIHVAAVDGGVPAVYQETVMITTDPRWANLTIDGSYLGGPGDRAEVRASTAATNVFEDDAANGVIENLKVTQTGSTGYDSLDVGGAGTTVRNVAATIANSGNTFGEANIKGNDQVWDHVTVDSNNPRFGLRTFQGGSSLNLTLRDVTVTKTVASNDPFFPALELQGSATLTRVKVSDPPTGSEPAVGIFSASGLTPLSVTIEDSLITGGKGGVVLKDIPAQPKAVHLTVRSTTIDSGAPGFDSNGAGYPSILAVTQSAASSVVADVSNSILVDGADVTTYAGSTAAVNCVNTDVPNTGSAAGCKPAGAANQSSSPTDLFVNAAGLDYHLKAGSPAIDVATTRLAGEPATDLDGNPRVVAINSCPPKPDLGPYEAQSPALSCPAPSGSITTPANGATFTVGQVVQASYACQDGAGGPGIASCTGTVPNGSPIDTSSVGQHMFTVTATSLSTLSSTVTNTYTVTAYLPPSASIATPANGATFTQGQLVHASYSCRESTGGPGITSCTGTVANGAAVDTASPGPHTFTVTATSGSGLTAIAHSAYTVLGQTPPVVSHATESRSRWRLGHKRASFAAATHRPPVGTTFFFTLNEPASVTLTFTQPQGGRLVNGKCVRQTQRNGKRRKCTIMATRGTLSFMAHAGSNSVLFQGPVSRSRTLRPGRYTMLITATNAAGQRSGQQTLTFTIVR